MCTTLTPIVYRDKHSHYMLKYTTFIRQCQSVQIRETDDHLTVFDLQSVLAMQ